MAVATQHVTTWHAPPRGAVLTGPRLAPRWLTPLILLGLDVLALSAAVLVAGTTPLALAYGALAVASLGCGGAYRIRITLQALDSVPWLVGRLAIPLVLLGPLAWTGGDAAAVLQVAVVSVLTVTVARAVGFVALRHFRRVGSLQEPAVIIGAGEVGTELATVFRDCPEFGVAPVGFLDHVSDGADLPLPLLGDVDELGAVLSVSGARRVIVAFGPTRGAELVSVLRTAVQHNVDVHVVPRFFDCWVAPESPDTDDVHGVPLCRVRRAALRAPGWTLKRLLDVTIAGAVLVLTAPLLAVIAVAVKVSSPGPVLFRQKRVGQHGEEIEITKFRTLLVNHDGDTRWSVDEDPRVTPVGSLLRNSCADELPQLWGVVRGKLSLVGPRPERPFFVERFGRSIDGYDDRHRLPVGLTGWAQVNGLHGDTSIEERARRDNQYIERWSLWRDIVILLRTVKTVLRRCGRSLAR